MGSYTHNCKLTGVPITAGEPIALVMLHPNKSLYEYSEESLRNYGTTYYCSNEGPRFKFTPFAFPIFGKYNDYGSMEDIVRDDNVELLEEHYGLTIEQIVRIVTSGRKGDGYDQSLNVIKEPFELPDDMESNEKWFEYYQRTQNDPMPFGNGKYPTSTTTEYRSYRDGKLVKVSKEEYDADYKLIHEQYKRYQDWCKENPDPSDDYGNPKYKEEYTELLAVSGMWIHGKVYEELTKDAKNTFTDKEEEALKKFVPVNSRKRPELPENIDGMSPEELSKLLNEQFAILDSFRMENDYDLSRVRHKFLHTRHQYTSPFTDLYMEMAKVENMFKKEANAFAIFEHYMFCLGRYHEVCGTAPQCGEFEQVMKVLDVAKSVIQDQYEEELSWREEE
jgi:hypothetical protein